jgi:vacuolar-type H+-ATPase subunit D/Vma8
MEGWATHMTTILDARLAQLRHQRREMRRELARIRWWLRLLQARRDLLIARVAFPGETGAIDLDAAWEALAADAPTSSELASAIWTEAPDGLPGSIDRIDALVARLLSYEARVSENAETVTADVVKAMGEAHRASVAHKVSHA